MRWTNKTAINHWIFSIFLCFPILHSCTKFFTKTKKKPFRVHVIANVICRMNWKQKLCKTKSRSKSVRKKRSKGCSHRSVQFSFQEAANGDRQRTHSMISWSPRSLVHRPNWLWAPHWGNTLYDWSIHRLSSIIVWKILLEWSSNQAREIHSSKRIFQSTHLT